MAFVCTRWILPALVALAGCAGPGPEPAAGVDAETGPPPSCADLPVQPAAAEGSAMPETDAEWRARLTPEQYEVLRREGTERAGTGEYLHHDADGVYRCAGCGNPLYDSGVKFDQGGWPSFSEAIAGAVATKDVGFGTLEVHCAKCGGHLGHIFNDGPGPTKKRH